MICDSPAHKSSPSPKPGHRFLSSDMLKPQLETLSGREFPYPPTALLWLGSLCAAPLFSWVSALLLPPTALAPRLTLSVGGHFCSGTCWNPLSKGCKRENSDRSPRFSSLSLRSTALPMGLISLSGSHKGSRCLAGEGEFGSQASQRGRQKPWPHQPKGFVLSHVNKPASQPTGQGQSPDQQGASPGTGMAAKQLQCSPGTSQAREPPLRSQAWEPPLRAKEVGSPAAAASSSSSENSKASWGLSNRSRLSELSEEEEDEEEGRLFS